MLSLGIDTGGDLCAAVLCNDGQHLDSSFIKTQRDQARLLAPLVRDLLATHTLTVSAIDRFAIATGPGSFTGLRVGLAFMRGLGLATQKPVLGFDHFDCCFHAVRADKNAEALYIIRESKRSELFACRFDAHNKKEIPFLITAENLIAHLQNQHSFQLCGDGLASVFAANPSLEKHALTLNENACALAAAQMASLCKDLNNHPAQPVYLREADVSFPKSA